MDSVELSFQLSQWAIDKPLVNKLYIFGSRARGDYREDSDLDIAIELDLTSAKGMDDSGGLATWMFETTEWSRELTRLLPFEVDLEQLAGELTPTIAKSVFESGILIYSKHKE